MCSTNECYCYDIMWCAKRMLVCMHMHFCTWCVRSVSLTLLTWVCEGGRERETDRQTDRHMATDKELPWVCAYLVCVHVRVYDERVEIQLIILLWYFWSERSMLFCAANMWEILCHPWCHLQVVQYWFWLLWAHQYPSANPVRIPNSSITDYFTFH